MKPIWRHLPKLFQPEKGRLLRYLVTALGQTLLVMASILLIREFLAGALGGQAGLAEELAAALGPRTALWTIAGLLLGCYFGASFLRYDNQVVREEMIKALELGVMERIVRHLLALSSSYFDEHSQGDLVHLLRRDVPQMREAVVSLGKMLLEGLLAAGLFVSALLLSPWLTLWALVAIPLALYPLYALARRTLLQSFGARRKVAALYDLVLQTLGGVRLIRVYQGEETETRNVIDQSRGYFDELVAMTKVRALSQVVLESLAGLGLVVAIIVGGFQVMDGQLGWPSLLAFLMAARAIHGPLNNVNMSYVQIQRNGAALRRIVDLLEETPKIREAANPLPIDAPPNTIELEHVSFGYATRPVLRDVSLTARSGELIGIVGPSGAGKSTLLNLVARFYDPTDGIVRLDGVDLRHYRLADLYGNMAAVSQEPFLFAASVRDNIRFGRPEATQAEVEAAARDADVHADIEALPSGYDTRVGAGGRRLSRGEAQRINIARAILKDAPLLLLDEATSSLDPVSQVRVQTALDRLARGRTTLAVAHRLSSVRHATQIIVLERGGVAGRGTHEQLLRDCALYARMWKADASEESSGQKEIGEIHGEPTPALLIKRGER